MLNDLAKFISLKATYIFLANKFFIFLCEALLAETFFPFDLQRAYDCNCSIFLYDWTNHSCAQISSLSLKDVPLVQFKLMRGLL